MSMSIMRLVIPHAAPERQVRNADGLRATHMTTAKDVAVVTVASSTRSRAESQVAEDRVFFCRPARDHRHRLADNICRGANGYLQIVSRND